MEPAAAPIPMVSSKSPALTTTRVRPVLEQTMSLVPVGTLVQPDPAAGRRPARSRMVMVVASSWMRMVSCVPGGAVSVRTVPDLVTVAGPITKAGAAENTTVATTVAATATATATAAAEGRGAGGGGRGAGLRIPYRRRLLH